MKRTFAIPAFFVALLLCIGYGCKKDASNAIVAGKGTITATVGGTAVNFNSAASATTSASSAASYLTITGYQGGINSSNSLELSLTALGNLTTGVYTGTDTSHLVAFAYTQYASGGNSNLYINQTGATTITQVTITALSDTAVSGTFSGQVYLYNFTSNASVPTTLPITNGQFDIKF